MLFVRDESGEYTPAPKDLVFTAARRLSSLQLRRGAMIRSSEDAKPAIQQKLNDYEYEMFACLFLDTQHRVLAFREIFRGSISVATVHPREVVKEAMRLNAAAVILAHNHPSGSTEPSLQDIELTKKLKEILLIVDVNVLDHLVIGDEVTSMADEGYLK